MSGLAIKNVTVRHGARCVIDDASASFAAARLTVVIRPNRAGKSTLLDVAAELRIPTSSTVRLDGTLLRALPRRMLAGCRVYLPQSPRVDWPISVERVVALGLTAHLPAFGGLPAEWRPRLADALERYDLFALRGRPATQLSGGELARAMLARATTGDPELLVIDEPTAGLDPRHASLIVRFIRSTWPFVHGWRGLKPTKKTGGDVKNTSSSKASL